MNARVLDLTNEVINDYCNISDNNTTIKDKLEKAFWNNYNGHNYTEETFRVAIALDVLKYLEPNMELNDGKDFEVGYYVGYIFNRYGCNKTDTSKKIENLSNIMGRYGLNEVKFSIYNLGEGSSTRMNTILTALYNHEFKIKDFDNNRFTFSKIEEEEV